MFDASTMWLPGFAPEPQTAVPATVSVPTPLVSEIRETLKPAKATWPVMDLALWDRSFNDNDRMQCNILALQTAAALPDGQAPTIDEAQALNLFNGWGRASALFGPNPSPQWKGFRDEIKTIVGNEGMEKIRAAVTTSFYTPPAVVRALWKGLQKMGFKGGNILDPSAGHGMFLANMPKEIAQRSQVTAIEPDPAAASVLKTLYGPYGVKVMQTTFEEAPLSDEGFYDVVITNVPFGDFGVPDRRSVPYRNFLVHDYFIARAMEVVRPGGVVAVITSAGTMDKTSEKVRKYLGTKARLLQAIRLPVDAFESFAGTSPITDVLIFQRLDEQVEKNTDEWISVKSLEATHPAVDEDLAQTLTWHRNPPKLNWWYSSHPDNILGTLVQGTSQYGEFKADPKSNGIDWLARVSGKLSELPSDIFRRRVKKDVVKAISVDLALRPGSFVLSDCGDVCVTEGYGTAVSVQGLKTKTAERIRGMIAIRDLAKALFQAQAETEDDDALVAPRQALCDAYDQFVKANGAINSTANLRVFAGDPALPMLEALEVENDDGTFGKADVFSRRTVNHQKVITHCDTPEEALKASLAVRGGVDHEWMAKLTGKTVDEVMEDLAGNGLVFRNPKTQAWETASAYLSGNVRLKLREAESAGGDWSENIDALRKVQPDDLLPMDIRAGLGSTWVPLDVYIDFCQEVLGARVQIGFDAVTGSWAVECNNVWEIPQDVRTDYGVHGRLSPIDLMQKQMNQQQATVSDPDPFDRKKRIVDQVKTIEAREKQAVLNEQFVKWLWSDTARSAMLARIYNDRFNCIVSQQFDGSHLALPGFSNCYTLHPGQKDGIWRIVTSDRATLLAHRVGFGKSLEMIAAGVELRRIGVASKIAYVVPNATLGDFVKEFVRAYPTANLLVATEQDFAGKNRRRFLARAASGDWDGVVLAHSSFERIRLKDQDIKDFVQDELDRIDAAIAATSAGQRMTVKQLERMKARWNAKLAKMANCKGDQDDCLTFKDIGFDWLMVDEAHYFKNLYRFSKMERVAGLPDSDSERAFDMFIKCQFVMQRHGGKRGVVFATGTPVANSMGELFTMQRFLQPEDLANADVQAFDAWATNFGEIVTALELSPDGSGYRMNRRFSRFVNIPELMAIFRLVADIQMGDLPWLNLPDFDRETIAANATPELKAFVQTLVERSEDIRNGKVTPQQDNMLAVTGDGRKAALDMRLVDPNAAEAPDGKVNLCVRNVHEIWRDTANEGLTQAIFCDMGTPNGAGFSVYGDIRAKLIASGVPEADIAFAHDAHSHAARSKLAEDIREGRIRIVIGSTLKLGVGVNIQDRLVALHHLDAPWRPADIEQREGRIIRQRNRNRFVRIFRYVTGGSFDAYMWQTLETKAKFIAQVMSGDTAIRTAEDLELAALSYSEVKALASGNPLVIEKAGVDAEVAKLSALRSGHLNAIANAKREVVDLPKRIEALTRRKAGKEKDAEALAKLGAPVLSIRGEQITTVKEMGAAIHSAATARLFRGSAPAVVGFIGDLKLTVSMLAFRQRGYVLTLQGASERQVEFDGGAIAAANALAALVDPQAAANEVAHTAEALVYAKSKIVQYQAEVSKPFAHEARFRELLARQEEINAALDIREDVRQAA